MMYNFGCAAEFEPFNWLGGDEGCRGSAKVAVMQMPDSVEQVYTSLGGGLKTGGFLTECASEKNPCRRAYEDFNNAKKVKRKKGDAVARQLAGQGTWDTLALLLTVRGDTATHLYSYDQGYKMQVDEAGHEYF